MNDDEQTDGDPREYLPAERPTVDAANPSDIKKRESRAKRDRRQAQEFWQSVFSDPVGRREIWRILESAHTFEERFACGPNGFPQPEATWFHAGEQALGQRLHDSLQIMCFEGVYLMRCEHDSRFAHALPPNKKGS